MRIAWLSMILLAGCTPGDSGGPHRKDKSEDSVPTTVPTGTTTPVGTPTTTTTLDCENLVNTPISEQIIQIETTEDFDFDADGRMIFAQWLGPALLGVDYQLNQSVISGNVQDTRGISVLDDGRIIIAYIGAGVVGIIDPATGSNQTLITGLGGPNALEVGLDDAIYFSETSPGRVREYNIVTGVSTPVAEGFSYPNGLVINETHDVLYVSDSSAGVYEVPKNADGSWGPKAVLFDPPGFGSYDGMEIDACGNLYILSFNTGKVVRVDPRVRPLVPVVLAELSDPNAFLWNALHWGSDRGGWRRDTLYVTDRHVVFALELGVPGKDQPVDAMP